MASNSGIPRLDFTTPHVLRNEAEYDAAVAEVDSLLARDPEPKTPDHDRLEFLAVLMEAYEEVHYPMGETGTPQSAVDFMLEQKGMTRADLAPTMGGRSRVSEFFAGKRRLSVVQIQKLRALLDVPADLLIEVPKTGRRAKAPARKRARPIPGSKDGVTGC